MALHLPRPPLLWHAHEHHPFLFLLENLGDGNIGIIIKILILVQHFYSFPKGARIATTSELCILIRATNSPSLSHEKPFPCQCIVLLKRNSHLTSLIHLLGNLLPLASALFNGTFVSTLGLPSNRGIVLGYALYVRIVAIIITQLQAPPLGHTLRHYLGLVCLGKFEGH